MEQTRRDTVVDLLCAGHRPATIIKLLKYPGGRSTTSPRSGRSQESEVHQGQSMDAHVHPRQKAWSPPVVAP
ncbi:Hypothetical protein FKW44_016477 [Caligus rogercresseyi]|uniref:Uncharacterized protein n=1 Tax=Caligus rogercresseyi TaxID=217165 RepID=A0A7T8H1T4_CALRO|nr:Hypothetical protein FKW44_016477 [Caligus rogercresseyi]